MRRIIFLCLFIYCSGVFGQAFKQLNFEQLYQKISTKNDTTYVVNFWATWCGPCVKELPYFETVEKRFSKQKIKVLLVSLDFIEQLETKFVPFLKREKIKSEVILLDAPNENEWIPKVNSEWSGAIPATLIYRGDKRIFFEQSFTQESLYQAIETFLN